MKVACREEMKKVDEYLLQFYSIEELVDKASDQVLKEIQQADSICIVCGPGNNGADGYALALKLDQMEKKVYVFACENKNLSQACSYYYKKCLEKNLIVNQEEFLNHLNRCDICVDAIFGFSCHSNPQGIYGEMIQLINQSSCFVVAIDVVSGLDCDCGKVYENCVIANQTITFFAYKIGFFNPDAEKVIGEVLIKPLNVIDFSNEIMLSESIDSIYFNKRSYDGHKGNYGKSFLICGSDSYHGAALLSCKASVYSGCGITCLCSTHEILHLASGYIPEAIHAQRNEIEKANQYSSILIGCGLDTNESLLKEILFETNRPLVIDASSLNDLANHLDWLEGQKRPIILTPHFGEFKRLCPNIKDPIISAKEFAKKYHVIVVLKGCHTLVTDGKHSYCNTTGNGAMATGGSGDVLAGMIVSFLAQGYSPIDSACKAVYLHGAIGDQFASNHYTVIPSKIIDEIPAMMKKYEEK